MLKICIDARMIESGGIGTYLQELLKRISKNSFKISLIVPTHLKEDQRFADFERIPCSAPIYSIQEQLQLPWIIPRCDLFWSPHFNIPVLSIRAKKRLVTIHDVFHLATDSLSWLERIYAKFLINKAVSLADRIITVSRFTQGEMIKYTPVDSSKISIIHSGSRDIGKSENKYPLPEKYLLFIGNVKPHKNLRGLVYAFNHVKKEGFPDLKLVIVGKREGFINKEDFSGLAMEDVHFTGWVDDEDLKSIYKRAQVFVFPSFYEGFGFPPLEAMSAGCPVVASNAASIPEICGQAVYYVDPNDSALMAAGIKKVLVDKDLRQELIEKGKVQHRKYCWDTAAKNHERLFEQVCDPK